MDSVVQAARRLVEHRPGHRVVSLYLDLDPERFATAPARASQVRSLIDEGARRVNAEEGLSHDERVALREDLERIDSYLGSREPYQGARALAIFSAVRDGLFEVLQLQKPVPGRIAVDRQPYIEPLIVALAQRRWLVVLVNRRIARLLAGPAEQLSEVERLDDSVHGQHDQGGWSQANYGRSVDKDVADHMRRVADAVNERWQRERFDRIALGGPQEVVPRLEALLGDEPRARIAAGRVEVDVGGATDEQVRSAVASLALEDEKRSERDALDKLAAGIGGEGRAAGGPQETVAALNERRVARLLMEQRFDRPAARCTSCGMLLLEPHESCPADGGEVELIEHLREAAVEAALAQGAEVMLVSQYPDLGPYQGVGALLRF